MRHASLFLICAIVVALVAVESASAQSMLCSALSHLEPIWLNSSTQATRYDGAGFTVFAIMPSGRPFLGAWQSLAFTDIVEVALIPSLSGVGSKCITDVRTVNDPAVELYMLRRLEIATAMCNRTHGTRTMPSGMETFVELEITLPDWPLFKLVTTLALANETVTTTVPASPNTYGVSYDLTYSPTVPKFSMRMENWNWTDVGASNSSIRLFFLGSSTCTTTLRHFLNPETLTEPIASRLVPVVQPLPIRTHSSKSLPSTTLSMSSP